MTAVQWLVEQYYDSEGKLTRQDFEQAKEMEKKQIIDFSTNFFEKGAKWQLEQDKKMYTEEEVLDLLCARNIEFNLYQGRDKVEEWFEQFKKK
jgi:hypothetical protein